MVKNTICLGEPPSQLHDSLGEKEKKTNNFPNKSLMRWQLMMKKKTHSEKDAGSHRRLILRWIRMIECKILKMYGVHSFYTYSYRAAIRYPWHPT